MDQRRASDVLKVLGFDPSLRNWGAAHGTFNVVTRAIDVNHLDVFKTEPSDDKTVRKNSTDLDAAEYLTSNVITAIRGVQAVFVEVPVGSQSAAAMKSYGICLGILGAMRAAGKPFFLITPDEVKKATGGASTASKKHMIEWAMKNYPNLDWPMQTKKGVTSVVAGTAEHMADAVAAIHAGVNSQPFKQLLALMSPGQ